MLRVVIAAALAVTLNQPEWREIFEPDQRPVLAVLHDVSGSMETEDVPVEKTAEASHQASPPTTTGAGRAQSRAAAAAPLVKPEFWASLAQRMDVMVEPFSSAETPPEEATDLSLPLRWAREKHPTLAAVVLISDGDRNSGEPPAAEAIRLRLAKVPVIAVAVGSETWLPDVELSRFEVPAFAVAGKPLRVPFAIESSLPRDETVTAEMEVVETGEILPVTVTVPAMGRAESSILWHPEAAGEVTLKLRVPAVEGEINTANNQLEAPLDVRKEQLRVLVVESFPRWEYRYLRNALERDPGVEVNTLLFHPGVEGLGEGRGYLKALPDEAELTKYDVVFLGDVGVAADQLTAAQAETLFKLVRDQATGLVFLPGLRGHEATLWETPLAELLPVVWDAAQPRGYGSLTQGKAVLTEAGRASLLTKLDDDEEESARIWANLPGFQWYAPALLAKAGSEVLAMHGTVSNGFGRVPLIVTKTFGAGKILFMGMDGAWRWRRGVEDRYHYRFWGQVVRWMAYQRNMARGEKLRLFYAPDRPRSGAAVTLQANVMSLSGEPLVDGVVVAQITAPTGKITSLRLAPAGEEAWGLFTAAFTPELPGSYEVRLSSADAGEELVTTLTVQGVGKERRGQPARPEVLAEIAQLTRGSLLRGVQPSAILQAARQLPEPEPIERRLLLWCHPLWVGLLIVLLAVFWIGRKAVGAF